MSKLEANINIKDFEEFKVSHDILCEMLQDKNINVGIRLKYIHEFNNKIEKENNMKVPFVKVNNQQEFERVVDKMEKETGFKLHKSSECGPDSIYNVIGIDDDFDILLYDPSHYDNKHLEIISADEYLTGTKENFTLDDLENGMVIELRNSRRFMYLNGVLVADKIYMKFNNIDDNFTHKNNKNCDFVKIYKLKSCNSVFSDLLKPDCNLTLIFDAEAHRNKSKISQKKLEIKNEIEKLEKELKSLEVK